MTSIEKRGARTIASIVREELINNPEFRFNHVKKVSWGDVYDCNLFFPTKRGYPTIYPNDPDFPKDLDSWFYKPPHPDDGFSFFFWRDYQHETATEPLEENDLDPEYMRSLHYLFVFDGKTNFWNGSTPLYGEILSTLWGKDQFIGDRDVPIACAPPNQETPLDRDRRYTYYRKNTCSWALIRDCNCNSSGVPCLKIQTEQHYFGIGYGDEMYSSDCDSDYEDSDTTYGIYSISENIDNSLENRMKRLGND